MVLPFAFVTRSLAGVDYLVLAGYLAINLAIGWWCARRRSAAVSDYFLGGRKVAWWAAAISFFSASTSSISFMALPARSFTSDWRSFGSAPAQAFAGILVGLVFVKLLRRLNLTTVYGYLERRFDRRVRLLGSVLAIFLKVLGRMSVVMLLPALALSTVTGMNVYVSLLVLGGVTTLYAMEGGFEAVIWTDVLQVIVMLGGAAIALAYAFSGVDGGFSSVVQTAQASSKFEMVSWKWDFSSPTAVVFGGMFLAQIFGQIADQPLMQRMLATKDPVEAKRTVLMGNAIGLVSSVVFFFIGTALWGFYQSHPDRLVAGVANDSIFPYFIANELPAGVVGLIIAALCAAAMGALSGVINSTAAIVVSDLQGVLRPEATEASRLKLARSTTLMSGLVGTAMAMYLAYRNVPSLWDEFLRLIALIGGGFPGVFALGLLTRRANANGAITGAIGSIAVTWWVQNYTAVNVFLHGFVAVGSCILIGYVASFFFKQRDPERVGRLTLWDKLDLADRQRPGSANESTILPVTE